MTALSKIKSLVPKRMKESPKLQNLVFKARLFQASLSLFQTSATISSQVPTRRLSARISRRSQRQGIHDLDLTDSAFLARATDYTLQLNKDSFKTILDAKLDDFSVRASQFGDDDFSDERLLSWCAVLRRMAGHFNIANKHFLENTGTFLDDSEYVKAFSTLIEKGLHEIERRYKESILTPTDWARRFNHPDVLARKSLGQAINYLGRYAYTFRFHEEFESAVIPLLLGRFDLVVESANPAMLPFTNGNSQILNEFESSCDAMLEFFDIKTPDNFSLLAHELVDYRDCIDRILCISVRNLIHLVRHEDVLNLMQALNLDAKNLVETELIGNFLPSILLKHEDLHELLVALQEQNLKKPNIGTQTQLTKTLARMGRAAEARKILSNVRRGEVKSFGQVSSLARLIEGLLPASEQKKLLKSAESTLLALTANLRTLGDENTVARVADTERLSREIGVLEDYNRAIETFLDCRFLTENTGLELADGERVLLFTMLQDRVSPIVLSSLMPVLQNIGLRFFNLTDDGMTNKVVQPWPFSPRLTPNFEALQSQDEECNTLLNDWIVDPERKEISCQGINYYEGFYERVSRVLKVYDVDWSVPHARHFLDLWLRQSDRAIAALDGVKIVLEKSQAKATLISLQSQFAPYFVLKIYASHHSNFFEHVTLSSSYENWATNVSGAPVSSVTILNNTTYPYPSAPAFGTNDHFENWFDTSFAKDYERLLEVTRSMTSIARAGSLTPEAKALLNTLLERKQHSDSAVARGADDARSMHLYRQEDQPKIFCMLGKIPYDLAVPYQGGPAHTDIKDWLNHTIETFIGHKNILLIKPHPHELNYAISHKPNETFLDLIERQELPENISILPYRGVNLQDLIPIVDHFLCWNGSSIPELGSQGISILAADDWARKNYPVDVKLPRDRNHYERMLLGDEEITMSSDFSKRCTAYIAYMVEAPFAIRNPYVGRSATNTDFNRAWINWDIFKPDTLDDLQSSRELIRDVFLGGAVNMKVSSK
ncbi:hypothetical protein [uncultured Aliiroseovarius sp.]|uniref:hypothetical protein n=1 Tax=uncultured Aliiroseovarius sp. TaxID=1658783 RepID=UPI0025915D8A|nr:hypothetical protein [uncultured Aliiroseovarius sp.]